MCLLLGSLVLVSSFWDEFLSTFAVDCTSGFDRATDQGSVPIVKR